MIKEYAYAKVNLTLEIKGKRDDGYHELESLIVPIDLYDELIFEEANIDLYVGPHIDNNNILKTVKLFKNEYNINKCVKVTLKKNIPIQAGLAGGSSDSSAVLRGLNRLWHLNKSFDELKALAEVLGSDNPYCVYQRPAIMRGRGEKLEFVDFKCNKNILLIKPDFGVSTKEIFQAFKNNTTNKENEIFNDLEKTTLELYPKLNDLYKEIKSLGYEPHMSGSGPTLFVLGDDLTALDKYFSNKNDVFVKLCKFLKNNY